MGSDVLILGQREVSSILAGRELELVSTAKRAYQAHAGGDSSLTHSTFLRFPAAPTNRMIALPAYLGGEFEVAGIKWIASFPGNHALGLARASAIVVLNSTETGRPKAILEGSIISATRTAASAALAAQTIHGARNEATTGIIGCGAISFEVIRFLRAVYPEADDFVIFDIDVTRAREFRSKCLKTFNGIEIKIVEDLSLVLKEAPLVCFATTALKPHVFNLSECALHTTILHISLRDLSPEVILSSDNVTDDIEHACRAETSLHLAERLVGDRDFIRCSLADILSGDASPRRDMNSVAVFSPFGLGVLDLAVAKLVYDAALEQGVGTVIDSFLTGDREQEQLAGSAEPVPSTSTSTHYPSKECSKSVASATKTTSE